VILAPLVIQYIIQYIAVCPAGPGKGLLPGPVLFVLSGAYARCMPAELNDTALMLRYKDGDAAAFEQLYSRHRKQLFGYLLRQVSNQQAAEDIFQEVWSRIIKSRVTYRPTAQFSTYIYRVARNCTIDYYRRTGRRAEVIVATDPLVEPAATDGDPVIAAESADARARLEAALAQLPDEQREVFLLREEGGFSLDEIGVVTGVGRETVKSRLRYALGKLRRCCESDQT
jgi:RNA polymerase sigma-70 factor (ECF subfamily)